MKCDKCKSDMILIRRGVFKSVSNLGLKFEYSLYDYCCKKCNYTQKKYPKYKHRFQQVDNVFMKKLFNKNNDIQELSKLYKKCYSKLTRSLNRNKCIKYTNIKNVQASFCAFLKDI